MKKNIRNIAIIAHVDHGKTTLVDQLLKQTDTLSKKLSKVERIMDSGDLEQERGITITSKNIAISWFDYHINIVDTPGHADFGGEVERVLRMVDSVLLLVDAVEGTMPQTRFVAKKAFEYHLNPIVVVNKIDRPFARSDWVIERVFDLFDGLGATDEQLDFPILYCSALEGYATLDLTQPSKTFAPLLDVIVKYVPSPKVCLNGPFQMQISTLDYSDYIGVVGIGRIERGMIKPNENVVLIDKDGIQKAVRVGQIFSHLGLERISVEAAYAGDIIAITGIENLTISDTICAKNSPENLPLLHVDKPTMSMIFQVNDSPFAGQEGKYITSRQLRDRLFCETVHNIALQVEETTDSNKFFVSGRGELHLSILIETMRREGYELAVSRPNVIRREENDTYLEPIEHLMIEVNQIHQGAIMKQLGERHGQLKNILPVDEVGRVQLEYEIPTRGLIGFHVVFHRTTAGAGILSHAFSHYAADCGEIRTGRKQGVLIANKTGVSSEYALWNLQARGEMIIGPQVAVYEGMIIGKHTRCNDLTVNVIRGKQLTNIRASGTDDNIQLSSPMILTLEVALEFILDDELIEITPAAIRLRKVFLQKHARHSARRI